MHVYVYEHVDVNHYYQQDKNQKKKLRTSKHLPVNAIALTIKKQIFKATQTNILSTEWLSCLLLFIIGVLN